MSNMETLEAISADYIKRSDALEEIHGLVDTMSVCVSMDECNGMRKMKERALTAIGKIEPADVQPVVRGKWEKTHRHTNSYRKYTGFDDMGEEHTITVREEFEYDWLKCPYCGASAADNFQNVCPNCGARMDGVE